MSNLKNILALSFILLMFYSCIKDKNPDIPAYICVPEIAFIPGDTSFEGSSDHKFTHAWISVDGQIIGANNFPVILPSIILDTSSTQRVRVFAGVDNNGISSSKGIYPFFDPYEVLLDLEQGKIDTIYPTFRYNPDVKFIQIEDFEDPGVVFGNNIDAFPDSYLQKQNIEVFEGDYSGQIVLDTLNPECYVSTTFRYSDLQSPGIASPVYLEINYKTNVPVTVGLIAHRSFGSDEVFIKGGMNPIDGWNKIYFELTGDVFELNTNSYSVFLRSSLIGSGVTDAKIYLDNIKIVHF